MDVRLGILWRLHLDDKFYVWDIETSGRNISGNKNLELFIFEPLEGDLSLVLSDISVHGLYIMSDLIRHSSSIGISLRGSKDKNPSCASIAVHYK